MKQCAFALSVLICLVCSCRPDVIDNDKTPGGTADKAVLLKGGDISFLTLIEQKGGKYYLDGKESDCVKILKDNGFNIVRLRLYNDPGNKNFSPSKKMYAGIQDEADILALAKRAKAHGLQIELTFHYSDYWTNGADQYKPHEWEALSCEVLKNRVYEYTKAFLLKMNAQGTAPEYVSLGNEVQAGLLYPEGSVDTSIKQTAEFLASGARAVREAAPEAGIIIHLDDGGNLSKYTWFFGEMKKYGVDYDIIGASYYPFWTGRSIEEISAWADALGKAFGKPVLLMETGFAWTEKTHDNGNAQLSHNRPYGVSKQEQKDFMSKLFKAIAASEWLIGDLYWDPIFIPAGDAGWIPGSPNVVSNSTLFDFEGNALPVFDAFRAQYDQ